MRLAPPTSFTQALTQCLYLSLVAETDAESAQAIELAEWFAARVHPHQVDACKAAASQLAEGKIGQGVSA